VQHGHGDEPRERLAPPVTESRSSHHHQLTSARKEEATAASAVPPASSAVPPAAHLLAPEFAAAVSEVHGTASTVRLPPLPAGLRLPLPSEAEEAAADLERHLVAPNATDARYSGIIITGTGLPAYARARTAAQGARWLRSRAPRVLSEEEQQQLEQWLRLDVGLLTHARVLLALDAAHFAAVARLMASAGAAMDARESGPPAYTRPRAMVNALEHAPPMRPPPSRGTPPVPGGLTWLYQDVVSERGVASWNRRAARYLAAQHSAALSASACGLPGLLPAGGEQDPELWA
jgi:hypothetical protein